jgi:hypothetical protein
MPAEKARCSNAQCLDTLAPDEEDAVPQGMGVYGMRDPYECLAVRPTATADDIDKSFRRLAKTLHPDANNNDPNTAVLFAELTAAHKILGNPKRRLAFDRGEIDAEGKPRQPKRYGVLLAMMTVSLLATTSVLGIRYLAPQSAIDASSDNRGGAQSEPRLIPQQNNASAADGAIPLGIRVSGEAAGLALEISGLPTGTTLSSGRRLGTDAWRIFVEDLDKATIHPPPGFSGTIDVAVELRLADDTVIDRGSFRLEWSPAVAPVERKFADDSSVSGNTEVAAIPAPTDQNVTHDVAKAQVDHDQIELLIARSQQLVSEGDVGAARTLLQRAAEAGDARAALALGSTYDPIMLVILHARGVTADPFLARFWYRKASGFGSQEAQQRLNLLASR